ncbi:hypothetical protein DdX_18819 [Ditylenchus destructor]|uniref:Uncharacterized protein n=1 Tax=Ditylenchus destructor TaxID=166010 RepID=A0AAD4MKH0_9BILA|nr:hypothetical protein DdX_18819 [Ditylenchus destructor]
MQHSFTRICFVLLVTATVLITAARSNIDTPESEGPEPEGILAPESEGPEADGKIAAEKINAVVRKGSAGGGGGGHGSGGRGSSGRNGGKNGGGGGNKVIGGRGTNSGRKSGKCKSKTKSCPAKDKTTNIKFVWECAVRILAVQHNFQLRLLFKDPGPNQLMLYDHTVPKTDTLQRLDGQSAIMEMKFDPSEKVHLYVDGKEVTTDFCEYDCDTKVCNCNVAFNYEENEVQTSDAYRTVQVPGYIKSDWLFKEVKSKRKSKYYV